MNFDDYKYDVGANDYMKTNEYVVVQEVTVLRSYTVEATGLANAVNQIEAGDHSGVICEDDSYAELSLGRVIRAGVNQ
jgi:hypothetical protein